MKILFQGDSITDAGRDYNNDTNVGFGYPLLIKAALGYETPEKYEFINKGINGSRITGLCDRVKAYIINLKPDVLSILIGVNDVWHDLSDNPNGVDADKYFKLYDMLIEEIKKALPNVKIMILEPFVVKGSATEKDWDIFRSEVEKRAKLAKMIAEKYNLAFVPLQDGFDKLCQTVPSSYWFSDGVHPTTYGHEFIKNEWLKVFKTL